MKRGLEAPGGLLRLGGDLEVARLGFGAMRITGAGIWGPPADRAECRAVLRRALELGVTLVDTAEAYGPYTSEELIAEALHPYPAGVVIATKSGFDRPGPGKWEMNGRPERLREGLEGSLRRLKLERIDLWQLHRVDPKVPADEQFDAVRQFQREGLVKHIGLSEVDAAEIEHARKYFAVISVQNKYNLAEREWEGVLEYCEREGIAFIPWHPLKVGKLAAAGGAVREIAERHGVLPGQVALAWLLWRSPVMLPIPGTSKLAHLEENVAAAGVELSEEEMTALWPDLPLR